MLPTILIYFKNTGFPYLPRLLYVDRSFVPSFVLPLDGIDFVESIRSLGRHWHPSIRAGQNRWNNQDGIWHLARLGQSIIQYSCLQRKRAWSRRNPNQLLVFLTFGSRVSREHRPSDRSRPLAMDPSMWIWIHPKCLCTERIPFWTRFSWSSPKKARTRSSWDVVPLLSLRGISRWSSSLSWWWWLCSYFFSLFACAAVVVAKSECQDERQKKKDLCPCIF